MTPSQKGKAAKATPDQTEEAAPVAADATAPTATGVSGEEWEVPANVVDPAAGRSETDLAFDTDAAERHQRQRTEADRDARSVDRDELAGPDPEEPGSAPGPAVIDGPFGTTVDSTDPSLGTLRVEVRSNVSLDNKVVSPPQKIEVRDTAEARACIAVGHLRLLDDDEALDDPQPVESARDDDYPTF